MTDRYRFQACIHITKDDIFLMGCWVDGKRSAAASGNVALCNNTEKSMNSPCIILWRSWAGTGGNVSLAMGWTVGCVVACW